MSESRTVKAVKVKTRDELFNAIDEEEIYITIESPFYDEIIEEIDKYETKHLSKTISHGLFLVAGAAAWFTTGPLAPILLAGSAAFSIGGMKNKLKKYNIAINKPRKQIDLMRKKGKGKYDSTNDFVTNI